MTTWLAVAAGALTAWLSAAVLRSSWVRCLFSAGTVVLGLTFVIFNYNDAQRAQLGEAALEDADLSPLGRRQAVCHHPQWDCSMARARDDRWAVVFSCQGSPPIRAMFDAQQSCEDLPTRVAGYLVNMNEAGGDGDHWVLQVGAEPRTFPSAIGWIGLAFVALGFAFPAIARWAERRAPP